MSQLPGEFEHVSASEISWSSNTSAPMRLETHYVDFELVHDNSLEIFVSGEDQYGDNTSSTAKIPANEVPEFLVGLQAWIENLQRSNT